MGKLNYWAEEEDRILIEQYPNFHSRKWKNISKVLKQNNFIRGEAECRERYVNHLDPTLNKQKQISEKQLTILYEKYEEYGPKWCLIQSFLLDRTQIKIKNVFYGNVRLFLKKMYKFFTKKTAVFINELRTDDLQSIYDSKDQFVGFGLLKRDFKRMGYKITQEDSYRVFGQDRENYLKLMNRILEYKANMTKIKSLIMDPENQEKIQNGGTLQKGSDERNQSPMASGLANQKIPVNVQHEEEQNHPILHQIDKNIQIEGPKQDQGFNKQYLQKQEPIVPLLSYNTRKDKEEYPLLELERQNRAFRVQSQIMGFRPFIGEPGWILEPHSFIPAPNLMIQPYNYTDAGFYPFWNCHR